MQDASAVPTPESEKVLKVQDQFNTIGEFLDWLCSTKDYSICHYSEASVACLECGSIVPGYVPSRKPINVLLADYFQIDMNKVEAEKEALLKAIRKK